MRVVILEGPDNIGKTELAELIAYKHQGRVRHWGPPKGNGDAALNFQLRILDDVIAQLRTRKVEKGLEVWDRSVIGESVYGPLYRQYDHNHYYSELTRLRHHADGIFLVVFYADWYTYRKFKLKGKADEKVNYQKKNDARKISEKFIEVAMNLALKNTIVVHCSDYVSLDARNDFVIERINRWLEKRIV